LVGEMTMVDDDDVITVTTTIGHGALVGMLGGRYRRAAPARAVTIQTEAKSCTLEGSPKAARASRTRGSAVARSAGFSRTILPSGPTFRSTQVMASRSPLDTFHRALG
jgi:hypothetical protein